MAVIELQHPLVQHKVGLLRGPLDTRTFRDVANELCAFLTYEATKSLPLVDNTVESWQGPLTVKKINGKMLTAVPILRAGMGMLNGFLQLIPGAKVSTIGLYRDEESLTPVSYHTKLAENIAVRTAFILDPMLATGGSVIAAIDILKNAGCKNIYGLFILAAPEGIAVVQEAHPDVNIYTCAIDQKLNEHGYIIPGLGDAGDRIFGTK